MLESHPEVEPSQGGKQNYLFTEASINWSCMKKVLNTSIQNFHITPGKGLQLKIQCEE